MGWANGVASSGFRGVEQELPPRGRGDAHDCLPFADVRRVPAIRGHRFAAACPCRDRLAAG